MSGDDREGLHPVPGTEDGPSERQGGAGAQDGDGDEPRVEALDGVTRASQRGPRSVLDERDQRLPAEQLEDVARLRGVLQSLLLIADRPLAAARLSQLLGGSIDPAVVRDVLTSWSGELEASGSGLRLVRVSGGYRLRTDPANAPWVRHFTRRRPVRLSRAALETLAIVAYRQPATRSAVDDVRGVDSSVVLRSLLEKELVRIAGRKDEPGRPMLYGTTPRFLEVFGLASLSDLPSLREFATLSVSEQEELFGDHVLLEPEEPNSPAENTDEDPGGDDAA